MRTGDFEQLSRGGWLGMAVLLVLLAAAASHSEPFDQDARDFVFCFSVSGYEQETWFEEPSALALDERAGLMYVADAKADSVAVFSLQGVPKSQSASKGAVKAPIGLAVDREGNLYVSENEGGPIKIINPKGEVSALDLPAGGESARPGRMAVGRDGSLYVADRAACRIYVFDKERKLKFTFGGKGDKRGEFKTLQDVAVDRQGRIYALDSAGVPVQVFDKKGKYIYRFGFRGDGAEDISSPAGLFVDQNDQIWVVDRGRHCLKVFDRSGSFLRKFGKYGVAEGSLFQPMDAEMDRFGRVYVLEAGARRLQVFSLSQPFEPFAPAGL